MEAVSVENPLMAKALVAAPTGAFISGAWREAWGGEWSDVINPATGNVITRVANVGAGDGLAVLEATAIVQDGWARTAPRARAELLRNLFEIVVERAEEFAALMIIEMGKPLAEARGEVAYGAESFRWFSEEVMCLNGRYSTTSEDGLRAITIPRPVGPVLAITPWNPPLTMVTRKLGPALVAGCTGVLKPSKLAPLTVPAFAEACRSTDVPNDVVNVAPILSSVALIRSLFRDSKLRKLSFTGSIGVGKGLLHEAADNVLWTSMGLGGCAPFIAFGDADLNRAVAAAKSAKSWNMGEACNAANRFYVSREPADEFVARLAAGSEGLVMGDGLDPSTDIGPVITSGQRQCIRELVEGTCERGAKVLTGGEDIAGPGYFYRPTVSTVTDPGESVICEELFGPVAPVVPFDSEEQVLAWASSSPVGLAVYVHAGDIGRALRMTERLEVGMTGINSAAIFSPAAPFGGVGHLGLGREDDSEGIVEHLRTIYVGVPV